MSRRSKRGHASRAALLTDADQAETPIERWPPPKTRPWMIFLAAACVLAWLTFLAYLAIYYGG